MADVVMPRLSDSMEEGTILSWMKAVGDEVAVGDELVEIETDKANMVYEADESGTLTEIVAEEGATLPIGEVIGRIGEAGDAAVTEEAAADESEAEGGERSAETGSEGDKTPAKKEEESASAAETGPVSEAPQIGATLRNASAKPGPSERIKASPIARRIAGDKGIDLASLSGSGPGGRIVKADVESASSPPSQPTSQPAEKPGEAPTPAATTPAAPTPGASEKPETAKGSVEAVSLSKLQQVVARRMAESKATAPHFYLSTVIDMDRAVAARAAIKAQSKEGDVVPSFNDMVVKACAIALAEFPRANGAYRDGGLELFSRINVGIAVAAQDSLVVPTVFDADRKGLRQIATEARALAARVRDGSITPPELSGGTFTVSNLGMFGVTSFSAVINPPQAGILAVGSIDEMAVVRDGEIVPGQRMSVTLACDHRILYGADGAEFLARIRQLLEEPVSLAL